METNTAELPADVAAAYQSAVDRGHASARPNPDGLWCPRCTRGDARSTRDGALHGSSLGHGCWGRGFGWEVTAP